MQSWSEKLRHSLARQQEAALQLQERTERLKEMGYASMHRENQERMIPPGRNIAGPGMKPTKQFSLIWKIQR